ncbi:hypothetical protein [Metaplanococcus flavidus]|uniref:Uncharacterized protein n=1 Tax=Metaplanococcus flavidus TaxID=569883 RepID=A0ABW3LFT1_9BACL
MYLFKKKFSLSAADEFEIKEFVSKTIEKMLITKEETINIHKDSDTVLSCSLEGNYIVVDIYQLSKYALHIHNQKRNHNIPFYTAARSLNNYEETIVYFDDHKAKGLGVKNLQAFYYICELLDALDIEVVSAQSFKCVW